MRYIFFLAVFLSQISTVFAQDYAIGDTIYVTSNTNLRPKPNFSSRNEVVATIPKGTKKVVEEISSDRVYIKVNVENKSGWLYYSYFTDLATAKKIIKEEEDKKKELQSLRDSGYGIKLESMSFKMNSADGVTPSIHFENIDTSRTIKYITFTLTPYNPVGDVTYDRISNKSTQNARGVGPITPGKKATYSFDNFWYNGTIKCIEIHKIHVEYMDGSTFIYVNDLEDIRKEARNINLHGECSYI